MHPNYHSYFGKLEKVSKNLENRKQLLFSRLKRPNDVSSINLPFKCSDKALEAISAAPSLDSDDFFQKLLAEYFNSKLTDDITNFQGNNFKKKIIIKQ